MCENREENNSELLSAEEFNFSKLSSYLEYVIILIEKKIL